MLTLSVLPDLFAVCRLAADAPLPDWATATDFFSITRTTDELSIVCRAAHVPPNIQSEGGWRCLKVNGPLDFSLTGVMVALAAPLADAAISIFGIATYDTDYLLVKAANLERAIQVLTTAGHTIIDATVEKPE
jgi:uncharacterized protein